MEALGNLTRPSSDNTCSGAVSLEGVRTAMFLSELMVHNCMPVTLAMLIWKLRPEKSHASLLDQSLGSWKDTLW